MTEILQTFKEMYNSGMNPTLLNLLAIIIILYFWNYKIYPILSRINYSKMMKIQSRSNVEIIDLLHQYQEMMLCDRVAIYEFHNTTHNLYGKSFLKFTCTYETTRVGVPGYNINKKDIPTSSQKEILELIWHENIMMIDKIDDEIYTPELLEYMREGNIKSEIIVPITFKGNIYGFMTIEFIRSENFGSENTDEIIKHAFILIGEISSKICKGN